MRYFLSGTGRMAEHVRQQAEALGWQLVAAAGMNEPELFFSSPSAGVCIDFSHPDQFTEVESYVKRTGTPLCCGTTGLGEKEMEKLKELGQTVPVLYSANFSIGIAVLKKMLTEYAPILMREYDVEIVEAHHRMKADAPSGTAKALAVALDPAGSKKPVYGRQGFVGAREKDEMGIFSLRGGTVAGEHEVRFFGEEETLAFTHSAASRRIFAAGAVKAAGILAGMPAGFYTLDQVLFTDKGELD